MTQLFFLPFYLMDPYDSLIPCGTPCAYCIPPPADTLQPVNCYPSALRTCPHFYGASNVFLGGLIHSQFAHDSQGAERPRSGGQLGCSRQGQPAGGVSHGALNDGDGEYG